MHPELIKMLWRNSEFQDKKKIISRILGKKVIMRTMFLRCYTRRTFTRWEIRRLSTTSYARKQNCGKIFVTSFLHKLGSKNSIPDLHIFALFHLMESIPFNPPHTIFINILRTIKTLDGYEDIYYVVLVNKILWEQCMYQIFNSKLDEQTNNAIMIKGSMIAKQQNFGV